MKRIHLFELEDQGWFPTTFRNPLTDALQFSITAFQLYEPVVPLIKKVMQHMNSTQIIDLCSGASGPWIHIQTQLALEQYPISVILTDKYPNIRAFEKTSKLSKNQIHYIAESIDATDVPAHLKGVRTMFTGFHHFRPDIAKAILQNAVDQRVAIGIFEFTKRCLRNLLLTPIITPLTVLLTTPMIRPISSTRFFWTYVIPVVPLAISWDSIVSNLRTYCPLELERLVGSIKNNDYIWEIGQTVSPRNKMITITYLLGYPQCP